MRSRTTFFLALLFVGSLAVPFAAHAGGIPFFGPIIPQESGQAVCAAGLGMLIVVINNVISLLLTLAIVFVAPVMIAWSGFLFVVNPVNASGREEAKKILTNTVVGIVIALAGWMIVDAIMAALYNANARSGMTTLGVWTELISPGGDLCLPLKGSLEQVPSKVPTIEIPKVPGAFKFQPGIEAQMPTASGQLTSLLSCMVTKVPAGVGEISSISDSLIIDGKKTFAQCATGECQHAANSCHYGGRSCVGNSYAVDFGDELNAGILIAAAKACGANYVGNEGNHLHVSVGGSCGCS